MVGDGGASAALAVMPTARFVGSSNHRRPLGWLSLSLGVLGLEGRDMVDIGQRKEEPKGLEREG